MAEPPTRKAGTDGAVVVEPKQQVRKARRYAVVFYNDDYTTKWFVIDVLMEFFQMSEAMATAFMIVVHETGRGIAGVFTLDIAETKAERVMSRAKEYDMPLRVEVEPEDDEEDG